MKQCYNCKIEKDESSFFKDAQKKNGLCSICKECKTEKIRRYHDKYPEIDRRKNRYSNHLQKSLEWQNKNKTKVTAIRKLGRAVRAGEIQKPSNCMCCNSDRYIKGLILDYSTPFDVVWLCSKCHSQYYLGVSWRTNKVKKFIRRLVEPQNLLKKES